MGGPEVTWEFAELPSLSPEPPSIPAQDSDFQPQMRITAVVRGEEGKRGRATCLEARIG